MPSFVPLVFFGALALVGLLAWLSWLAERERRQQLGTLAASLGWQFDPSEDHDHDERFAQFEVFRRGHGQIGRAHV